MRRVPRSRLHARALSVTSTADAVKTGSLANAAASTTLDDRETADPLEDHSSNYQLVIVGTGWAGYQMFTQCKKHRRDIELAVGKPVDIVVVSKRNVRPIMLCA
ncbi:hypothetical protein PINS_up018241 [Pythium insidiosum]|nr:hypothetical protein PINS_up018241 [Pythium insidiosum]